MSSGPSERSVQIGDDDVRRQLRMIDVEHRATLQPTAELIDRLYDEEADAQTKWDVLAGGANRSTWMKIGGVAVLTSAVLAACSSQKATDATATTAAAPPSTAAATTLPGGKLDPNDVMLLRFSASVENLAVKAYTTAAPLLTDAAIKDVATLFAQHHTDHAALFNGALNAAGEKAVTDPNIVLLAKLKPMLDALSTQDDVLRFAQGVELAAASTYFSTVGVLKGPRLGYTAMTIGGTEYRHAALLSFITKVEIASTASGFLTTDEAFAPAGV